MTLFLPAKLNFSSSAMLLASPLSNNGSGDFFSLRDSEGFIEIDQLNPDNIYPFYHWKNIGGMDA
jgi:molybdopterin biosynthesis enzyme